MQLETTRGELLTITTLEELADQIETAETRLGYYSSLQVSVERDASGEATIILHEADHEPNSEDV